MQDKPSLHITWAKAFGEIYCHHATLFIPSRASLFCPETICVGITVRNNIVTKGEVTSSFDTREQNYLPCSPVDGGLEVPLNSTPIIEALSLNSWTKLKGNVRGTQKMYPLNMFYISETDGTQLLPFNTEEAVTPYMMSEHLFRSMKDGDKVESIISF